jgi:hypothetical protein
LHLSHDKGVKGLIAHLFVLPSNVNIADIWKLSANIG